MKKFILGILICLVCSPICFGAIESRLPKGTITLEQPLNSVVYVTKTDDTYLIFSGRIEEYHLTNSKDFSVDQPLIIDIKRLRIKAHAEKAETWAFIKTDCEGEYGWEIRWVVLKIVEDQSKANKYYYIDQPIW